MNHIEESLRGFEDLVIEVKGRFKYDRDSKRYHRYLVGGDQVVGAVCFPKGSSALARFITRSHQKTGVGIISLVPYKPQAGYGVSGVPKVLGL